LAGSEEVVLTMIELCRDGPPGARVEAVDQREAGAIDLALRRPGELFSVLTTA
jgi:acylphosphatase